MITGFNTDIEHDGVVYHVQTEDKGLESPLILSLVYAGGAILASKRSPYEDLIASGFDEEALVQRLKHQHRLICAAINAGRIEDLKRMGARTEERAEEVAPAPAEAAPVEIVSNADDYASLPAVEQEPVTPVEVVSNASDYVDFAQTSEPTPPPAPEAADMPARQTVAESSPYTVYDSRRQSPLGEAAAPDEGLVLTLLKEEDFRAGQTFQIRILVEDRSGAKEKPLAGVALSVKILGTTFRPQIYSVKTERDGVAVVSAQIPRFTSGRAGILIRAVSGGRTAETRRVIHAA
ncbi:MAG: hypothetical protein M3539_06110 [Acidobacteriota bacterium]|nr:hypothetical protein [Acidobacteriota bacterium]